jgi:hypothetical protein
LFAIISATTGHYDEYNLHDLHVDKSHVCSYAKSIPLPSTLWIFAYQQTKTNMKSKILLMTMLAILAFSYSYAQEIQKREMPPKHRGMHPRLQSDGTVVDDHGKTLGSIKNGKVCDETGKVIGIIAADGDVATASGKSIGKIQNNGSFKSTKGHVVTTDPDGVVNASGKDVARVEAGYKYKNHGCALHCFFSAENPDAEDIDKSNK